ncbi:hypothetical protein BB560_004326 [Smittium megazygosporum]|uniref:Uncharacterized protein n=1 Tax=Smittium megazygosporum TaxID=133381 RepID=A0A2T9Z9N8_9FUNG|nr:hypothetical protein BB560_004326 [Smittium megazygosporum]
MSDSIIYTSSSQNNNSSSFSTTITTTTTNTTVSTLPFSEKSDSKPNLSNSILNPSSSVNSRFLKDSILTPDNNQNLANLDPNPTNFREFLVSVPENRINASKSQSPQNPYTTSNLGTNVVNPNYNLSHQDLSFFSMRKNPASQDFKSQSKDSAENPFDLKFDSAGPDSNFFQNFSPKILSELDLSSKNTQNDSSFFQLPEFKTSLLSKPNSPNSQPFPANNIFSIASNQNIPPTLEAEYFLLQQLQHKNWPEKSNFNVPLYSNHFHSSSPLGRNPNLTSSQDYHHIADTQLNDSILTQNRFKNQSLPNNTAKDTPLNNAPHQGSSAPYSRCQSNFPYKGTHSEQPQNFLCNSFENELSLHINNSNLRNTGMNIQELASRLQTSNQLQNCSNDKPVNFSLQRYLNDQASSSRFQDPVQVNTNSFNHVYNDDQLSQYSYTSSKDNPENSNYKGSELFENVNDQTPLLNTDTLSSRKLTQNTRTHSINSNDPKITSDQNRSQSSSHKTSESPVFSETLPACSHFTNIQKCLKDVQLSGFFENEKNIARITNTRYNRNQSILKYKYYYRINSLLKDSISNYNSFTTFSVLHRKLQQRPGISTNKNHPVNHILSLMTQKPPPSSLPSQTNHNMPKKPTNVSVPKSQPTEKLAHPSPTVKKDLFKHILFKFLSSSSSDKRFSLFPNEPESTSAGYNFYLSAPNPQCLASRDLYALLFISCVRIVTPQVISDVLLGPATLKIEDARARCELQFYETTGSGFLFRKILTCLQYINCADNDRVEAYALSALHTSQGYCKAVTHQLWRLTRVFARSTDNIHASIMRQPLSVEILMESREWKRFAQNLTLRISQSLHLSTALLQHNNLMSPQTIFSEFVSIRLLCKLLDSYISNAKCVQELESLQIVIDKANLSPLVHWYVIMAITVDSVRRQAHSTILDRWLSLEQSVFSKIKILGHTDSPMSKARAKQLISLRKIGLSSLTSVRSAQMGNLVLALENSDRVLDFFTKRDEADAEAAQTFREGRSRALASGSEGYFEVQCIDVLLEAAESIERRLIFMFGNLALDARWRVWINSCVAASLLVNRNTSSSAGPLNEVESDSIFSHIKTTSGPKTNQNDHSFEPLPLGSDLYPKNLNTKFNGTDATNNLFTNKKHLFYGQSNMTNTDNNTKTEHNEIMEPKIPSCPKGSHQNGSKNGNFCEPQKKDVPYLKLPAEPENVVLSHLYTNFSSIESLKNQDVLSLYPKAIQRSKLIKNLFLMRQEATKSAGPRPLPYILMYQKLCFNIILDNNQD